MSSNRVLSCPIPEDINPLSPNGFKLSIERLPGLTYFAQEVNIPEVSINQNEFGNPLVKINIPGDQLDFSALTVNFLVDSDMANYKAIFNWLNGLGFPESYEQAANYLASVGREGDSPMSKYFSDGVLMILGNTGNMIQQIRYIDMYPISLGSLSFSSTNTDVQYLVGSVTFLYTYFKFE
jgi:hypothetical protein